VIRSAQKTDIPELTPLLKQLFSIESDFSFDSEKQANALEFLLGSESAVIMVAEKQRSVIGMTIAQLIISTAEGGRAILVEDVVVDPVYRKQGIGAELLQAVGSWGHAKGATRMQLLADISNKPALAFYDNSGWRKTQLVCLRKYHKEATDS